MKKCFLLLVMLLSMMAKAGVEVCNDGKNVTGCDKTVTEVIIPDGVETIDEHAFHDCGHLRQVTIPSSVTTIKAGAFEGCTSLTINIPASVVRIEEGAFSGVRRVRVSRNNFVFCNTPQGMVVDRRTRTLLYVPPEFFGVFRVPNGIRRIGDQAFYECYGLTSVIFSSGVRSIGDNAFAFCESLEKVTLNDGLESIARGAFWHCPKLKSLALPASIKNLAGGALATVPKISLADGNRYFQLKNGILIEPGRHRLIYCSADKKQYRVPENIRIIDADAFAACRKLTKIVIPNGVIHIGESAFYGCSGLTELTFPTTVKSIGIHAFLHCNNLEKVTIRGNTVLEDHAFSDSCRKGKPIHLYVSPRVRLNEQILPSGSHIIRINSGN